MWLLFTGLWKPRHNSFPIQQLDPSQTDYCEAALRQLSNHPESAKHDGCRLQSPPNTEANTRFKSLPRIKPRETIRLILLRRRAGATLGIRNRQVEVLRDRKFQVAENYRLSYQTIRSYPLGKGNEHGVES